MNPKELLARELVKRILAGQVIGVGTGSTVDLTITEIAKRVKSEQLNIFVVPSSRETAWRCAELGLRVLDGDTDAQIDWGFDGADAVDKNLRAIKGRGGALLREKILAARCAKYLLLVDEGKLVENIASKAAVPIEVIPEARYVVERALKALKATSIGVRQAEGKFGSIVTEYGNLIIDASFAEIPSGFDQTLKNLVGVVETGLFLNFATEVLVASPSEVRVLTR